MICGGGTQPHCVKTALHKCQICREFSYKKTTKLGVMDVTVKMTKTAYSTVESTVFVISLDSAIH